MFILKHFRITIRLRKKSVPLLLISSLQELESCNEVSLEFSMSQLKDGETHCFFHSLLVCWFFFLCFLSLSAYSSTPRSSQKWFCACVLVDKFTQNHIQTDIHICTMQYALCVFFLVYGREERWVVRWRGCKYVRCACMQNRICASLG